LWPRLFWYYLQLKRNQWLKKEELEKIQFKKLKSIIQHAYKNVKFYHDLYRKSGVSPNILNKFEDLNKFPTINKEDIQKNYPKGMTTKNTDLKKCIIRHTAGSTGKPMTVAFKDKEYDFYRAVHLLSLRENGYRLRDLTLQVSTNPPGKNLPQKLGFFRTEYVSLYDNPSDKKNMLNSSNFDVIYAHTSYVKILAKSKEDLPLDGLNPRLVFTTAELMDDSTRNMINRIFNTELIDLYGCVELNRTGWECSKHEGYHMDIDSVAFEFIKDNEHVAFDEKGQVIMTGLFNYTMPLIRYDIGDIAVPKEETCSCGRGLPLIKNLEGRTFDFIVLSDGSIYSPLIFINSLRPIEGIKEFQVVQENVNKLKIFYQRRKGNDSNISEKILSTVRSILGEQIEIEPIEVSDISREKSGKRRYVKSKVKIDWIKK